MIRKTITAIRNFFTDRPQEPETIFKPLVKLKEKEPKQEVKITAPKELWIKLRCLLGFHYWKMTKAPTLGNREYCYECGETR
jgi:hypothetical protein